MTANETRKVLYEGSRANPGSFISFIIGMVIGFSLSTLFVMSTMERPKCRLCTSHQYGSINSTYDSMLEQKGPKSDNSLATKLYKDVRVLCWIMTNPANHQKKARHVKRTWGKRCNKLLFMSSAEDEELGTVALPVGEGRNNLWAKTKEAFKYIYKHHMDDADWFLKADDDTYTIVENLRYLLYPYSPDMPIYFGCKFKRYVKQGYMGGGAGYVLSKEALRRFVEIALPNPKICKSGNAGAEDVQMGICLQNVKVIAGDSRDSEGHGRFFPFATVDHLFPKNDKKFWYWRYRYYKTHEGLDCCSHNAISYHYVIPKQMHLLDYLIYDLRPFGIATTSEALPEKLEMGKVLPAPSIEKPTKSIRA